MACIFPLLLMRCGKWECISDLSGTVTHMNNIPLKFPVARSCPERNFLSDEMTMSASLHS